MDSQKNNIFPYARPKAMKEIFNLIKEEVTWNPSYITVSTLKTIGIAPSKEEEAIKTLKFLGILNENGEPTGIFIKLRENFKTTLKQQVRQAYKSIFDQIPNGRINQDTLVKFFMENGFGEDTAEYQGALFVYLCNNAGIDLPNAPTSFKRARFKKAK